MLHFTMYRAGRLSICFAYLKLMSELPGYQIQQQLEAVYTPFNNKKKIGETDIQPSRDKPKPEEQRNKLYDTNVTTSIEKHYTPLSPPKRKFLYILTLNSPAQHTITTRTCTTYFL